MGRKSWLLDGNEALFVLITLLIFMVCFSYSSLRPSSQPHNLLLFYIFAPMSHSATLSSLSWWVSFLFVQPHSAILKRGPVKAKQHKLPIVFSIIHGLNHLQRYQDWTLSAPFRGRRAVLWCQLCRPCSWTCTGALSAYSPDWRQMSISYLVIPSWSLVAGIY